MPGHTPAERSKHGSHNTLPGAVPQRGLGPALPAQAAGRAVDVQAALGTGFNQNPLMGRSLLGSGKFTKAETKKGFRVLDRPKLGNSETPVAFPGVPRKK